MTIKRLLALLLIGAGCSTADHRPELRPIEPAAANNFSPALVARGATLAAIGNCHDCHTAPGGRMFAGGAPLPTPFGTIYSTNITPDPDTGIGRWSEQAFLRAMREGVDREGRHLYPAFPYDHFTLVTDEDSRALYAYFMTREPVRAAAPPNELRFPFNIRKALVVWKRLYLREGPYQPDPNRSAQWNRGAYLTRGLGHCGACHTPRNVLGAENKRHALAGGEAEGWDAYALDRTSPAPVAWNAESLFQYLRHGWHPDHGVARGPMASVAASLASVPESDVRAIATYVVSQMSGRAPEQARPVDAAGESGARWTKPGAATTQRLGESVYEGACSSCHDDSRPPPFGGIALELSTAVNAPDPRNLINVVLYGLPAAEAEAKPIMPGFVGAISDEQLTALLEYMRSRFSGEPAWRDVDGHIESARDQARNEEAS